MTDGRECGLAAAPSCASAGVAALGGAFVRRAFAENDPALDALMGETDGPSIRPEFRSGLPHHRDAQGDRADAVAVNRPDHRAGRQDI